MQFIRKNDNLVLLVLLFVAVSVTYIPFFSGELFIDDHAVLNDVSLHTTNNIDQIFLKPSFGDQRYRPLASLFRVFEYQLFKDSVYHYRLINLGFFGLTCFLLFLLLKEITNNRLVAGLSSFLFAIHPFHAESIFYLMGLEVTLAGLCLIASVLGYLKAFKKGKIVYYFASLGIFGAALLFQEVHMAFPVFLTGLSICLFTEIRKQEHIKRLAPFFIISICYFCLRLYVAQFTSFVFKSSQQVQISILEYFASFFELIYWYIFRLVYPQDVLLIYSIAPIKEHVLLRSLGLLLIIILLLVSIRFLYKKKLYFLALIWFVTGFLPLPLSMFMMPNIGLIIEPHWFFFSSIGFFLAVGLFVEYLYRVRSRLLGVNLFSIVVIFFVSLTIIHNRAWQTEKKYNQYWLRISPTNPIPRMNLASIYIKEKRYDDAIAYYQIILDTSLYRRSTVYSNLATVYAELYMFNEAKKSVLEALKYDTKNVLAYNCLGTISVYEGNYDQAKSHFLKSIEVDKFLTIAKLNLADLYNSKGQKDEAAKWYKDILRTDPYYKERKEILFKLAYLYYTQTNLFDAKQLLEQSVEEYPEAIESYLLLGTVYANNNEFNQALKIWQKGNRLDPTDTRFVDNINKIKGMIQNNIKG